MPPMQFLVSETLLRACLPKKSHTNVENPLNSIQIYKFNPLVPLCFPTKN